MLRTRASVLLVLGLLASVLASAPASAQGTTHFGVTFPEGDQSFADAAEWEVLPQGDGNAMTDPTLAEGPPDCEGDNACFASLGREAETGLLVLTFVDNALTGDGTGDDDIYFFEAGSQVGGVAEEFSAEISVDGTRWISIGEVSGGEGTGIDIDPFADASAEYRHVRLASTSSRTGPPTPGPDIDAVGAISSVPADPVSSDDGSDPAGGDDPAADEPAADPRDFPNLFGTFQLSTQDDAVTETYRVRWTGDRDVPYEIVLVDNTQGNCPPVGTVIGRAIRNSGPQEMSGTIDTYVPTVAGCELSSTDDANYGLGDDRLIIRSGSSSRDLPRAVDTASHRTARQMASLSAHLIFIGLIQTDGDLRSLGSGSRQQGGALGPLYVATEANFPDGLAVAGLAGRTRGATVLIDPARPIANGSVLEMLAPFFSEIVVVGGEAAVPSSALPAPGQPGGPDRRLAGANRFDTADVLAAEGWPGGAHTVYVATGANFPDALSGGAAASVEGAPVLLVDGGRMPKETASALERLAPQQILVLGGTAVIPESMVSQLRAYAPVVRLAGPSRTETAVAVSAARFHSGAPQALVASGDSFGPALVAASAAWAFEGPLLLVSDTRAPQGTLDELQRLGDPAVTSVSINGEVDELVLDALGG